MPKYRNLKNLSDLEVYLVATRAINWVGLILGKIGVPQSVTDKFGAIEATAERLAADSANFYQAQNSANQFFDLNYQNLDWIDDHLNRDQRWTISFGDCKIAIIICQCFTMVKMAAITFVSFKNSESIIDQISVAIEAFNQWLENYLESERSIKDLLS